MIGKMLTEECRVDLYELTKMELCKVFLDQHSKLIFSAIIITTGLVIKTLRKG